MLYPGKRLTLPALVTMLFVTFLAFAPSFAGSFNQSTAGNATSQPASSVLLSDSEDDDINLTRSAAPFLLTRRRIDGIPAQWQAGHRVCFRFLFSDDALRFALARSASPRAPPLRRAPARAPPVS